MSAEQKSLLETDKSREADNTLHCYSATNSHAAIQHREMTPVTTKPRLTTENRLSAFSGDSLTSASMLGSVVQPRDLQELMSNLERATGLVKRYLQENQGLNSDRRPTQRPLIPRLLTNYLLVITFLWQVLNVGLIEGIDRLDKVDNSTNSHKVSIVSNIVMTVFQLVHILVAFFVSFKLVKQVMHGTASGSLLAQSYLSTVLLFAGLYTLEYRFDRSGWNHVVNPAIRPDVKDGSDIIATLLFLRMLYFSISTGSLCGTSAIEPLEWYGGLTVSLQMLMSFVYFASILGLGLRAFSRTRSEKNGRSCTRKIRECVFREKARREEPA